MARIFLTVVSVAALVVAAAPASAQGSADTKEKAAQGTPAPQDAKGGKGASKTAKTTKAAKIATAPKAKTAARKKPTMQQEVESAVESGTVPARYRSSVPKEYQQYIPFGR